MPTSDPIRFATDLCTFYDPRYWGAQGGYADIGSLFAWGEWDERAFWTRILEAVFAAGLGARWRPRPCCRSHRDPRLRPSHARPPHRLTRPPSPVLGAWAPASDSSGRQTRLRYVAETPGHAP